MFGGSVAAPARRIFEPETYRSGLIKSKPRDPEGEFQSNRDAK
ncbi:hypothetical protein D779_4217 [Imhoffiella purpurea]|uniref:Uncharacterized protein n=1 Tax=Imhoffiella purpurea TaxID=1249627 RepID=W9VB47_9GAMM|nr:hypothetical protein D779_4217 [Imhoffiella purpurea]